MSLRQALRRGEFLATIDTTPPKGTDLSRLLRALERARGRVTAVNVPDMPSAVMRVGALPVCRVLIDHGLEPILQMTCRDRNRLALQADLLGAAVLGIENVLILGGDDVTLGDQPGARPVFDLDSAGLLAAARALERGVDAGGHALRGRPSFCLGAVVNPDAASVEAEVAEMAAKVQAGAEFFQTQPVFEVETLAAFMQRADPLQVPVLAGIFMLKSAGMARYMNAHVPEVSVPEWVIGTLEAARDPLEKSLEIALDLLRALRPLCAGVHVMSVNGEEQALALLDAAGL